MASMAEGVRTIPEKRRIAGEGWSLRADRVELLSGNGCRSGGERGCGNAGAQDRGRP
jgi:hypothetical protein